MSIVTREGKGSRLTTQEMDGNFNYLYTASLGGFEETIIEITPTQLNIINPENSGITILDEVEGKYYFVGEIYVEIRGSSNVENVFDYCEGVSINNWGATVLTPQFNQNESPSIRILYLNLGVSDTDGGISLLSNIPISNDIILRFRNIFSEENFDAGDLQLSIRIKYKLINYPN
jgi:hypothetical protein